MSSTRRKQLSLGENDGFILYMFKGDLEMIKKWAEESPSNDKRPKGGRLIGLWTNTLNPVVHIVSKDDVAAEDYLFLKSPQFEACHMFSHIGHWSFEKCRDEEQCYFHRRFVSLEVEVKNSCSISYHPVLLFEGLNTRGKIEILEGENPFRLPEEPETTKEENLKKGKNEGVVAFMKQKFESGFTKVTEIIPDFIDKLGTVQQYTMQAPTGEQTYHDEQSKMSPSTRNVSQMPNKRTSLSSQNEIRDASTCTKTSQWYLTEHGQKALQEMSNKLEEVINEKPKISRDNDTHNIMILFSFENKKCVITFPPNFPKLNAELYCTMQTRSNSSNASSSYCTMQTRSNPSNASPSYYKLQSSDPIELVQEVINNSHK